MPRTFAYVRVSTTGQTTENQIQEIEAAGFKVGPRRVVSETVSGSSAIEQRPGFIKLLNKLEQDDVLIVTKLDRLGRNAMDVATTVARLAELGVRVHCLALGGVDLTSPAGRMTMGVINSVAQFERDLLIERTQSGLKRAKAAGEVLGRPPTLTEAQRAAVQEQIAAGASVSELAKRYDTSRQTIMRIRDAVSPLVELENRTPPQGPRVTNRTTPFSHVNDGRTTSWCSSLAGLNAVE
jgi:putative DNA-invertase from lambdoid prophage Rac